MKVFKKDCGCKESSCPEEKVCGCIVEVSTDCVRWKEEDFFSKGERLTDVIRNLQEQIQAIQEKVDLVPKEIIQDFLIGEENTFTTKYNFIPSTVRVYIDGVETLDFELEGLKEVTKNGSGNIITINYKTVDDVQ